MPKRPPVDPDFYSIGVESGMSDTEIQADWDAYCDDLEKFHAEIDTKLGNIPPETKQVLSDSLNLIQTELDATPLPVQHGIQPFLDEIRKWLN